AIKNAFAFLRAQVAAREQAAEPSPGGAVARIRENVRRAVGENEPRAGMIGERQFLFALDEMRAHHARDRIAVGEPETIKPDMRGLQHQLLGMRGAAQEREVGSSCEFEVTRHVTHRSRAETSAGGSAPYRGKAPREKSRSAAPPCPRPGNNRAPDRLLSSTRRLRCARALRNERFRGAPAASGSALAGRRARAQKCRRWARVWRADAAGARSRRPRRGSGERPPSRGRRASSFAPARMPRRGREGGG